MEQLKDELLLKEKEISLLLAHCKALKLNYEQIQNQDFNEMIQLITELSHVLKENASYQEHIRHYEDDAIDTNEYILELKRLIQWFSLQKNQIKLALNHKEEEFNDFIFNMDEIISEKNKEITELQNKIYAKNEYTDNILQQYIKKLQDIQQLKDNYEEEIIQLHQNIQDDLCEIEVLKNQIKKITEELFENNFINHDNQKLIKNLKQYQQQLEYDKTNMNDMIIDKDLEIYKLYQEIEKKDKTIYELEESKNKLNDVISQKDDDIYQLCEEINEKLAIINKKPDEFVNPLYFYEEIDLLKKENQELRKERDELKEYNMNCIALITNIKKFINESQESNYIPLFNPIRILENLIGLYSDQLCSTDLIKDESSQILKKNYIKLSNRC